MKRFTIALFILLANLALAQDKPPVEVTGAYQFTRFYGDNVPIGWDASVNAPFNKWFGTVFDFGGATQSQSGFTSTALLAGVGPQFTFRTRNLDPYFRVVIGPADFISSGSVAGFGFASSTVAFLVAPGGGADFRLSDRASFRLGINYPFATRYGTTIHAFQAVAGITFKVGRRREGETSGPTTVPQSGAAEPLLGAVVDNRMRVVHFFPNSVLSSHGIELEDVITSIDGKEVKTPDELTAAMASLTKGTQIKVGYLHRGQWQTYVFIQL